MRNSLINQRGAGLIEVMIAITLGLLVLAVLLKALNDSRATFRSQDAASRLQENARYAIHLISRDVRNAGFRGCVRDLTTAGTPPLTNSLNTNTAFLYDFATPIQGFEGNVDGTWTPVLPNGDGNISPVTRETDVLTIRAAQDEPAIVQTSMATDSGIVDLPNNMAPSPIAACDIVMVSDCHGNFIFQVTDFTASNGNVAHIAGTSVTCPSGSAISPGNSTASLGRRLPQGAQLFKALTTSYFLRNSSNGTGPALWRRQGNSPAQELVEGIHNMQILYGLDSDGNLMPDGYVPATTAMNFRNVVAVRIALLLRSPENASTEKDTRAHVLNGSTVGPFNDNHLYRVFETTITLRNKVL